MNTWSPAANSVRMIAEVKHKGAADGNTPILGSDSTPTVFGKRRWNSEQESKGSYQQRSANYSSYHT